MADNTRLNAPSVAGGDLILTEDPGLPSGAKICVSKIRLGSEDVDGGDVTASNPFPIMPIETSSTAPTTGARSGIDAAAMPITTGSIPAAFGVQVKASNNNSCTVYVGTNSNVTAGTNDATDGFELGPGESILLKCNNARDVYVIASCDTDPFNLEDGSDLLEEDSSDNLTVETGGQKVFWTAI